MAASDSQLFLQIGSLDFTDYVTKNLQPTAEANKKAGELVDGLATFLKEKTSFPVSKVVKGGSFGKGTQIRDKSDLDLVVFIEGYVNTKATVEQLNNDLKDWKFPQLVQVERPTPHAAQIKYRIRTGDPFTDVDILPTQDHLRDKGKRATYAEMAAASASKRQDYSASLASLQIEFVSKQPALVKNLIRLVKHWRKTYFTGRSEKGILPTSYPLELIVIHLWEKAGELKSFKLDRAFKLPRAFKAVMEALANNHTLDVQWTENYQAHEFAGEISRLKESQRRNRRPFVLDPANPFNDVAAGFKAWPEVAEVARKALGSPALTSVRAGW